ncbi:MAG TPA: nucleotide pyrophosphohydrolase [Candidatus Nanoarchaeia archaeon]|nr:nucleotide pyrophosphohydrolase [Candidatus Nanoarchaeia archaeon]
MSFKQSQQEVDKWASQFEPAYWRPHEILARITEEVGELARLINHSYGPKPKKSSEAAQEMGEELADIIFALFCLANSQGIDLDKSFSRVMDKAYGRDNDRFPKKTN